MDQTTWLKWRMDGIGSSDIGVIMGVIPLEWNTPHKLWKEKVYKIPNTRDSASMKRGRDREPIGLQKFEELTGEVVFAGKRGENANLPFLRASYDGINLEKTVVVEIKWPSRDDHQIAIEGNVPEKYYPQCQHILFVSGLQTMFYLSCHDSGFALVVVERDNEFIKKMLEAAQEFWQKVLKRTPPAKCIYDYEIMFDNEVWKEKEEDLYKTDELIKVLEKKRELLKKEIIEAANGESAEGKFLRLSKIDCKGNIDYSEAFESYHADLREKFPDLEIGKWDTEKFRKPSFTKWQIRSIA